MKVSNISSLSVSQALRYSMKSLQSELAGAQKEVSTGKLADVGLDLGNRTGKLISLKGDIKRLSAIMTTNDTAVSRLDITQDGLARVINRANDILASTVSGLNQSTDTSVIVKASQDALADITDILNTTFNGDYIFSGINSDMPAMSDYDTGPAKAAFDTAFQGFFGFTKDDAAAQTIDAATMQTFLDTVVEPQFLGAGWNTNVSNASDEGILSRITLSQSAVTSVSANEVGIRKVVMASVIMSELYSGNIGGNALNAVSEKASQLSGEGVADLAALQGRAGLVQEQLSIANERLQTQSDLFETYANSLESVDPYEASTRLTSLLTQIETSYALTARIQQLSLMRFLA